MMLFQSCDGEPVQVDNGEGFLSSTNLENATTYAINETAGNALIIWHNDEIVAEEYEGITGQTTMPVLEVTKSFTGMITALGVQDALLDYDERVGRIIPDWEPFSERGSITVRELLNMTSGLQTVPEGVHQNQTPQIWLGTQLEFTRGTTFSYGPTPYFILSWIFLDQFQVNPIIYMNENVFEPLGLNGWSWELQLAGRYPNLAFGLNMMPLELLQVGKMLINNGTLDGVEIFSPSQINQMLVPAEAAPGFSNSFWLNSEFDENSSFANRLPESIFPQTPSGRLISEDAPSDLYMMAGNFGQRLYIIPSLDIVIVRYGSVESVNFSDREFFRQLLAES